MLNAAMLSPEAVQNIDTIPPVDEASEGNDGFQVGNRVSPFVKFNRASQTAR